MLRLSLLQLCLLLTLAAAAAAQGRSLTAELDHARAHYYSADRSSIASARRAVELADATGDDALRVQARAVLGRALTEWGELREGRKHIEDALGICGEERTRMAAPAHLAFAWLHIRRGLHGRGRQHAGTAQEGFAGSESVRQRTEMLLIFAIASLRQGDTKHGVPELYAAQELAEEHDYPDVIVDVQLFLAYLGYKQMSYDASREHAERARHVAKTRDLDLIYPRTLFAIGNLDIAQRAPRHEVAPRYEEALRLARELDHPLLLATSQRYRGVLAQWVDQEMDEAIRWYREAIATAIAADELETRSHTASKLADLLRKLGRPEDALAELDRHAESIGLVAQPRLRVYVNRTRCQCLATLERFPEAFQAAWIAADTERWLGVNEATAETTRREYARKIEQREQASSQRIYFWSGLALAGLLLSSLLFRIQSVQRRANREQRALNEELQHALSQVQELRGLLPICASCKAIRDDEGYWHRIENYLTKNSKASLSHGICPTCVGDLYPDILTGLQDDSAASTPDNRPQQKPS